MKITFLASQYSRISGGNRALLEYANRLKKMGYLVRWLVFAKPARWYRIDHWARIFNKKVTVLDPDVIDWLDNQIPIEILSVNDESLIPESDILLATAWQTADFSAPLPESKGLKFYLSSITKACGLEKKVRRRKHIICLLKKL